MCRSHSPGNPCNDISGVHENLGWSCVINKQKRSSSQTAESYSFSFWVDIWIQYQKLVPNTLLKSRPKYTSSFHHKVHIGSRVSGVLDRIASCWKCRPSHDFHPSFAKSIVSSDFADTGYAHLEGPARTTQMSWDVGRTNCLCWTQATCTCRIKNQLWPFSKIWRQNHRNHSALFQMNIKNAWKKHIKLKHIQQLPL